MDSALSLPGGYSPTPEQEGLITFAPNGHLLVKGQAGSGKTLVLAARAKWIKSRLNEGRMLFLTYNAVLKEYVSMLLQADGASDDVTVETYHEWVRRFARDHDYLFGRWLTGETAEAALQSVVDAHGKKSSHRLFSLTLQAFWRPEIRWMFQRRLEGVEDYKNVQRKGRGDVRLDGPDREVVWGVYADYLSQMVSTGDWDIEAPAHVVFAAIKLWNGRMKYSAQYDHVFVDEVQDFNESWLRPLNRVAKTTLTLAGDLAQRIYRREFTWKSAGIDVTGGRSKKLPKSFRTTRQIMEVAQFLATNPDLLQNEDYTPPTLPDRDGPPVVRFKRHDRYDATVSALRRIPELTKQGRVVVASQFAKTCETLVEQLSRLGIQAPFIKERRLAGATDNVVVTTFHQLKGLEFDHVILTGLEDSGTPSFVLRLAAEHEIEQETATQRRLVYVAMTRARQSVTLAGGLPFCRFFDAVPSGLIEDR